MATTDNPLHAKKTRIYEQKHIFSNKGVYLEPDRISNLLFAQSGIFELIFVNKKV